MAAASSWSVLAAELNAAALSYDKVVTALSSEEWLGSASGAMAAAVQPYVTWMTTTAAQAEEAASQARAAAAAYETALAATVPPPLVAANRAESLQLQATNVLGQNTPLIAQLEAQYGADVGPGCQRDVQLFGSVVDGDQGDPVQCGAQDRQRIRHRHPERRGGQRHEQFHGEQCPVDAVAGGLDHPQDACRPRPPRRPPRRRPTG